MARKIISKEELLKIASGIIKENGLEACSIRTLSKEAGVAVGTIYNYFPSRKVFLEELFRNSWLVTLEKLIPICQREDSPHNRLKDFALTLKEDVEARKGLGKTIYGSVKFSKDMCESHKEIFEKIVLIIKNIIYSSDINKNKPEEDISMVSKWIFMILIDSIVVDKNQMDRVISELNNRFL